MSNGFFLRLRHIRISRDTLPFTFLELDSSLFTTGTTELGICLFDDPALLEVQEPHLLQCQLRVPVGETEVLPPTCFLEWDLCKRAILGFACSLHTWKKDSWKPRP